MMRKTIYTIMVSNLIVNNASASGSSTLSIDPHQTELVQSQKKLTPQEKERIKNAQHGGELRQKGADTIKKTDQAIEFIEAYTDWLDIIPAAGGIKSVVLTGVRVAGHGLGYATLTYGKYIESHAASQSSTEASILHAQRSHTKILELDSENL